MDELSSLPQSEQEKLLLHAASEGRADVIAKLLRCNSRIRGCVDEFGHTPLHLACAGSHVDAVRSLLRCGVPADALATSGPNEGRSARDLARADEGPAAQIRGAFSAELLQSVMMEDVVRTAELLRAGVQPSEPVGPGSDSKSLLEFAEELLVPSLGNKAASYNPAVDLLRGAVEKVPCNSLLDIKTATTPDEENTGIAAQGEGRTDIHETDEVGSWSTERTTVPGANKRPPDDPAQLLVCDVQLEEKDELISTLRSMLANMAEEQEVLMRLVHKQGSTGIADHFRRLRAGIAEAKDSLASKTAECSAHAAELHELRQSLALERESHASTRQRASLLESKLTSLTSISTAEAAIQTIDATEATALLEEADCFLASCDIGERAQGREACSTPETPAPQDQAPRPWRDPFGGYEDFNVPHDSVIPLENEPLPSSENKKGGAAHQEQVSRTSADGSWWSWGASPPPRKVGGRLVLRV